MSIFDDERMRKPGEDAEAAEKHHGDAGYRDNPEKVPADEETEGATNALNTPVAPPEMAKERDDTKE